VPNVFSTAPGGYRFFFYSNEGSEPPHVHVEKGAARCKWWLTPARLAWNDGFRPPQLRAIRRIIGERSAEMLEAWHGYFPGR
jgi:hypothetical protein